MLYNSTSKLLIRRLINPKLLPARASALFINGLKATDTYVYVNPHIDYPVHIAEKEKLQENICRRKYNFDLNKLESLWAVYEELQQSKTDIDEKKLEVSKKLTELMKADENTDKINKYKIQIDLLKDNLKILKSPLWCAQEVAILEVLKLPNILHSRTPDGKNEVIYTHSSPPPSNNKSHLQLGPKQKFIHFNKNKNYYLMGDAAMFELGAEFYVSQCLKQADYVQFSNPDFVKSVIVEGCGNDHTNPDDTFILHHNEDCKVNIDSRLHLTGGASLYSFLAYHGRNILHAKTLPLRYFSIGRQYTPSPCREDNLFHVSQSSVVQSFCLAKNDLELDSIIDESISLLKNIYSTIGYHFRLTILSADKLSPSESLRISVEMFSTSINKYMEVAYLSVSGDYISKRLLLTYLDKQKDSKFPHIISGSILNVPRLLACGMEQDGEFTLPEPFQMHNWTVQKHE